MQQRALVYKPKHAKFFKEEPLKVDLGLGKESIVHPRETFVQPRRGVFGDILNNCQTRSDEDAIPGVMQAFADAKLRLRGGQYEKMARQLGLSGRTDLLLKIARSSLETDAEYGFKFSRPTAREFARAFWVQSMLPEKKDVTKALKGFEQILEIFSDARSKERQEMRLRNDAVILGVHMGMLADAAIRFNNAEDYKGKTLKAAEKFLAGIEAANTDLEKALEAIAEDKDLRENHTNKRTERNHKFQIIKDAWKDYLPVLEACGNAKQVLKAHGEVANQLAVEEERLREVVQVLQERVGFSMATKESVEPKNRYKDAAKRLAAQKEEAKEQKDDVVDEVAEEEEEQTKA